MEKFQRIMERSLIPVATKLASNKYLKAVSGGFSALLVIVMVGAIASLLAGLNIPAYQAILISTGLKGMIGWISTYTTGMIALYAVFLIGKSLADQLECKDQSIIVGITTLLMFLLTIPTGVTGVTEEGVKVVTASAIKITYFGAPGLFTAIILGLIVPNIYNVFVKKNIVIKMPEGVPPQIANGFSGILPCAFLAMVFIIIRWGVSLTSWGTLNDMIYGVLRAPLGTFTESPFTFMLLLIVCNLLWWFGIHGGMVVMPFLSILYMTPALENLDALANGVAMPNLLMNTWWFVFAQVGGSGGIIGLTILMTFFAKSERFKAVGKIAILPSLCGISEPIVFGAPLVLNVMLLIPMILAPLVAFLLSYFMTVIGVLPYLNGIQLSTGTPIVFAGILAGGWRAGLWQLVIVVIQFFIYLPFSKICDKQILDEEALES
ncbi:PTS sugar transporter subunit IIC [Fusibacter ferrireducens]|uniref:Permease IIC component n=1 Tax=Fusibacter ferrireducens TaxID=2785058 RepID=A0ABR9ZVL3_9FIRM|nr:PTS transporter subunit EIIC [Fusibacter ferrireducens]MBF4694460.1 PTS sugar transporter subunit IIC [Fusibacter ferrireducens]